MIEKDEKQKNNQQSEKKELHCIGWPDQSLHTTSDLELINNMIVTLNLCYTYYTEQSYIDIKDEKFDEFDKKTVIN